MAEAILPAPTRKLAPDGVIGMLIFIFAEVMFFAGLISAHVIVESRALGGAWPPVGQPRLPLEETAINTALLLASGALVFLAHRARRRKLRSAPAILLGALVLGVAFVSLQGREWVALISEGLSLTSSTYGGFFYLIVGSHALHAVAAISALGWATFELWKGRLPDSAFATVQLFWYFVVLVWPAIYVQVYL
ncbi:MAG TPA: heme-copper oxidase subunit III [Myxococcota bacterium]|nr:heme-copper oxidase subunit III [Myxococcota bacterium]